MTARSLLETSASNSSPQSSSLATRSISSARVELSVCEGSGVSEEPAAGDDAADEAADPDGGGEAKLQLCCCFFFCCLVGVVRSSRMGDFDLDDLEADGGGDRVAAAAGVVGDEAGTAAAAAALDSDMAERATHKKHWP